MKTPIPTSEIDLLKEAYTTVDNAEKNATQALQPLVKDLVSNEDVDGIWELIRALPPRFHVTRRLYEALDRICKDQPKGN